MFKLHRACRWFISFRTSTGFLLFAVHRRWRLAKVRPWAKPGYTRWYFGPFEIERSGYTATQAAPGAASTKESAS